MTRSKAPPPERGRQGGGHLRFRELSPLTVGQSRRLRNEMTEAEKKLWYYLRQWQLKGFKFRRQHPIGPYIADFACIRCKLVIELDGGQHALQQQHDKKRDAFIQKKGYRVVRFWNTDVLQSIDGVVEVITRLLNDPLLTSPLQGEESGNLAILSRSA